MLAQERRESGLITTYKILQAHANSTYRVKCTLEECPAAVISLGIIAQALRRTGAVKWVATRKVDKLQTTDLVTAEVRRWRVCVFIAELCLARQKEEAGTLFFAQMNESFCNSHHCAEQSLLETQGEGEAVQDIHQHAGKGPRLCIVGAISQFGPLVCPDPDGTGNYRWQNAKGESVSSGGEFVELDA